MGYTQQHSIPTVMALANAVGAATAMGAGAGRNVANAETVMRLLQTAQAAGDDGRHHAAALDVLRTSLSSTDA